MTLISDWFGSGIMKTFIINISIPKSSEYVWTEITKPHENHLLWTCRKLFSHSRSVEKFEIVLPCCVRSISFCFHAGWECKSCFQQHCCSGKANYVNCLTPSNFKEIWFWVPSCLGFKNNHFGYIACMYRLRILGPAVGEPREPRRGPQELSSCKIPKLFQNDSKINQLWKSLQNDEGKISKPLKTKYNI